MLIKYKGENIPNVQHIMHRIKYHAEIISQEYDIPVWKLYMGFFKDFIVEGCSAQDYFLYKFFLLNKTGKERFITLKKRLQYDSKNNTKQGIYSVRDKESTLKLFEKYISRDWCGQNYNGTEEHYSRFAEKHEKCILKPMSSAGGRGIQIISTEMPELYRKSQKEYAVVEELVMQHEHLNKMYSKAINTIRVVTIKGKCVGASLRIGANGGAIDNAHAGGIFAEVDIATGIIKSNAMNYQMKSFIRHPDTGMVIPGFEIPYWKEIVTLTEEAATLIPGVSLVGWDIAVTPDGPTIIEVNDQPGLELVQAPAGNGLRSYIK